MKQYLKLNFNIVAMSKKTGGGKLWFIMACSQSRLHVTAVCCLQRQSRVEIKLIHTFYFVRKAEITSVMIKVNFD